MAAESPATDRLTELLEKHSARAKRYAFEIPVLRAAGAAASARIARLARTPAGAAPPQRTYVDVVVAAPNREWAEDVAERLRRELPDARIDLRPPGARLADAPTSRGYVVGCEISWRGRAVPGAKDAVKMALAGMSDVEVDDNQRIDVVVVTPREN
jgi:hypothetical protein